MTPRSNQQLDLLRDERREQIKQAALRVFARRGIVQTKTSMIAAEAGISEGLIYRYFTSKDELFTVLVQELVGAARRQLEHLHELPGTPYAQISALTEHMLDAKNKYAFMLIHQARKADEVPEAVAQALQEHSPHALVDRLVPIFVKGQAAGHFSAGDPRELLFWYFSVIDGLIMLEQGEKAYGFPTVDVLMRMLNA